MRIADVLNRRGTPALPAARVARNRWSDLESALPEGWTPELSSQLISVAASDLEQAQQSAARSGANVLVFADADHDVDDGVIAALSWWQHVCDYAVSVAPGTDNTDDWLATYQRESEQLNRAGYEAFRGAAAGVLAVPRALFDAAGGLDVTAGVEWQIDLAYRLAQRGAVFVLAPDVAVERPAATAHISTLTESIPLLPERRSDWRRAHDVPTLHVVVDCKSAPDAAAATIAGVLDGEYRDLSITVVGWADGNPPWDDPRVQLLGAATASFPSPFRLEVPAGCLFEPFSIRRMLNRMRESQVGLYQALVEPNTDEVGRSFAVRLLRTAAVERSRRLLDDDNLDDIIDELFGSLWVDGQRFGIRHHADVEGIDDRDPDKDADDAEDSDADDEFDED